MSLLRNSRCRPRESRAPWLLPAAKPRLVELRWYRTGLGNRPMSANQSAVPSVDALSTTITSYEIASAVFRQIRSRHCRVNSSLLRTGMTIETS